MLQCLKITNVQRSLTLKKTHRAKSLSYGALSLSWGSDLQQQGRLIVEWLQSLLHSLKFCFT